MSAKQTFLFMPRALKREEAAAYIRCSATKFDELVLDGRMPKARKIDRRKVWDIRELDQYFELLPLDGGKNTNEWDDV